MPPLTEARTLLYVISCRKPDGEYQKISRLRPNKREAHLHAPKRAGTYALLTAPYKADLQEEDLTAVVDRETGLPLDTDFRERTAGRPDLAADWEAIRRRHPQDQVEDRIAAYVWNLGKPIVLFLHGYNVTPGGALQSGWALQEHLDRTGVGATVVVFRWPSNGHLLDYFPDQQAAGRFGSYALVNAVMSLRRTAGAPGMLHCLAHSMGTYVVTRALGTIAILQMQRFLPVPEAETILDEVVLMQIGRAHV